MNQKVENSNIMN